MTRLFYLLALLFLGCQAAPVAVVDPRHEARLGLLEVSQLQVNGMALQMTPQQVTAAVKPDDKWRKDNETSWMYMLSPGDSLMVRFGEGRRVDCVVGNRLQLPDRVLVDSGDRPEQVEEALGKPAIMHGQDTWFYNYTNGVRMCVEISFQKGVVHAVALTTSLQAS